jgi:hypothetical protein
MVLVAMGEAGLSVGSSADPVAERARVSALVQRLVRGIA